MEEAEDLGHLIGAPPQGRDVPWTLGDVALALVIPVLLIGGSVIALVLGGEEEDLRSQGDLVLGLLVSIVLQMVLLVSVGLLAIRKHGASFSDLGLRRHWRGEWWFPLALVAGAFAVVYAYITVLIVAGFDASTDVPNEVYDNIAPIVVLATLSLVFAPIVEEIFFRGFIFGAIKSRFGRAAAIVASGLIFGAVHLGNPGGWVVFAPISAVGMIFAWGYLYSGSIVPAIMAHFLFNLVNLSLGIAGS